MTINRRAAADLAAGAALVVLTGFLYRHVAALYWVYDSPFHLRQLAEHSPLEVLFSRQPWQAEKNVFTPAFLLSLHLDNALGGGAPRIFHLHQLAAIAGAAVCLFALLRAWLSAGWAALGGALFLVGPSVAASAPLLMVRHYFEALALAALALLAQVLALRRRRPGWAWGSALLYFVALLEKEIAAPAILAFGAVREAREGGRVRAVLPHLAALAGSAVYRLAMLERPLAGHGWILPGGLAATAFELPGKAMGALFGGGLAGAAVAIALAVALAALPPRTLLGALALAAAALLPVLPVSRELTPRLVLASWCVLAAAAVVGWARLASDRRWRRLAPWAAGATLVAAAIAGRGSWAAQWSIAERMSLENRAYVDLDAGDLLRHPASATSTLLELRALAGARADWYQDDVFLCRPEAMTGRIWTFDAASRSLRDVTAAALAAAPAWCATAAAPAAPLAARLWWRDDGVHWQLGPHPEPGYSFVMDAGRTRLQVPRQGGYAWQGGEVRLRVRYDLPAGGAVYSPELVLPRGLAELRFER